MAQATQAQAQKFEEAAQGAKKHASAFDGLKRAAAGYLGIDLLRRFVETAAAQESMQKALDQLAGSTKAGAAEMEYLRATAARLGVGLDEAAKSYVSLAASTKGTALEGEKTRAIFEAVTGAMSKLGKTGAETQTALLAISQMASKGTVAMEELRGQLGESLPGAMQAAANGLGLTTAELGKLVQEGKIDGPSKPNLARDQRTHLTSPHLRHILQAGRVSRCPPLLPHPPVPLAASRSHRPHPHRVPTPACVHRIHGPHQPSPGLGLAFVALVRIQAQLKLHLVFAGIRFP